MVTRRHKACGGAVEDDTAIEHAAADSKHVHANALRWVAAHAALQVLDCLAVTSVF
jgi:hypothetical protein